MTKTLTNNTRRSEPETPKSLCIERHFTTDGVSPYDQVEWATFKSIMRNEAGEVLFEQEVEAPAFYSQTAVDIIASKYFRKAGVPQVDADGNPIVDADGNQVLGGETSIRQVVHRLAGCWTDWGRKGGYFDEKTAEVFYDEVVWLLLHQYMAPNSPQWFNTGLYWAYGIDSDAKQRFYYDPETGEVVESRSRYQRPEPMACFLLGVDDSLTNDGGIADHVAREMRIFQAGAGAGTNFSTLRGAGEPLSGGGVSSGMMSFLRVFDRSAGAIKSGGTTRRAAKMVVVDADHPEIEEFIWWKVNEEKKVAALVAAGYDSDWRGEAYQTVSGQNANNSVSLSHEFMKALAEDGDWQLRRRVDGAVVKTLKARDLWRQIAEAAWASADPGVQFNGIMNDWNPVPHIGRIRTTNPCSEAMQIDGSSCNLLSLRLTAFLREDGTFDSDAYVAAARLGQIILEISVYMAQFPDAEVALNTWNLRYTGLGYADLGALLMRQGLPYDSNAGRSVAAALTSLLTATATMASAEMAAVVGPYGFYDADNHMRIIRNHVAAHEGGAFEGLAVEPVRLNWGDLPDWALEVAETGSRIWGRAVELGSEHGFRNAQTTLMAPTGTISFAMGCDTTGVEPDFALVKFKSLAGGGTIQIVNKAVEPALQRLGYDESQRAEIIAYISERGTAAGAPHLTETDVAVFDTAVGERSISPEGHVRMLAAIQPFVSAGISKTVNMPADATVEDIAAIHQLAHDLGVKCVAVYRDGSKLSQVLSSKQEAEKADGRAEADSHSKMMEKIRGLLVSPPAGVSPSLFYKEFGLDGAPRFTLSPSRVGRTWEFKVGGTKVFLRTGEYEDGSLGEIFIDLAKEGATLRGVISCFAMAVSHGLQSGIPLRKLVDQFTFQTFEPRGIVERHPNIKMASSIVDAVFKILAVHYLRDDSLAQVKLDDGQPHLIDLDEEDVEVTGSSNGDRVVGDFTPTESAKVVDKPVEPVTVSIGETCTLCGGALVNSGTCRTCTSCGSTDGGCA